MHAFEKINIRTGKTTTLVAYLIALVLSGCASYGGSSLQKGVATLPEVLGTMGEPAMRWNHSDGSVQLAFPRGPSGTQTFMVHLGPDGKLERIDKVLRPEFLNQIRPGMSQDEVMRLIGPPQPHWTQYFKWRNELAWEWLICDNWSQEAFFNVLFDGTTNEVRSTMQRPNIQGPRGSAPGCGI
jgi:hypothetical protein